MAKFILNIETDDTNELRDIVARIAGPTPPSAATIRSAMLTTEFEQPAAPARTEKPKAASKTNKANPVPAPIVKNALEAQIEVLPPPPATYDQVKEALISLMDKKSASAVQGLLKDKFGVIAFNQLPKERLGEALEALAGWIAEA